MSWTAQQSAALLSMGAWLKDKKAPPVFRLFGFAGSGKSTLAREIMNLSNGKVLYAAYTGKASLVMRSKGCPDARTLHSLIYKVEEGPQGKPVFRRNYDSELRNAAVLVVDECSMVGEELGRDVLSFGRKVLVLGDPFQLPPVKDAGFFTNAEPDFMLTEIHRQAADNPIIRMSMDIREGRRLAVGAYGDSRVIRRPELRQSVVLGADQVLCGLNRSRRSFNQKIRSLAGFEAQMPEHGDKLICLKNDKELGLLNGSLWDVKTSKTKDRVVEMEVHPEGACDGEAIEVAVPEEFFLGTEESLDWRRRREFEEFDFGYAITVHKGQGSQWPRVVLFDESGPFRENAPRWTYTGLTRAADQITVVI